MYDEVSEYNRKMSEYRDTFPDGSMDKRKELEEWFKTHYPDI